MKKNELEWTTVVKPKSNLFDINLSDVWRYRDLIILFIKRDFISVHKQTLLGPLWYIIQPVLTTITFSIIFGSIANLPHGDAPGPIFYMSGIVCWNLFSSGVIKTSNTFLTNAGIFGKVYFPRLTVPISVVISNLIGFAIQFITFMCFVAYYMYQGNSLQFNWQAIAFLPVLIILISLMAMGIGITISALTTKYRDLSFLVGFGVQLLMYFSPVVLYEIPDSFKPFIMANPMSSAIQIFRSMFIPGIEINYNFLIYSFTFTLIMLFFGILIFSKVEKSFADTV